MELGCLKALFHLTGEELVVSLLRSSFASMPMNEDDIEQGEGRAGTMVMLFNYDVYDKKANQRSIYLSIEQEKKTL